MHKMPRRHPLPEILRQEQLLVRIDGRNVVPIALSPALSLNPSQPGIAKPAEPRRTIDCDGAGPRDALGPARPVRCGLEENTSRSSVACPLAPDPVSPNLCLVELPEEP